MKLIQDPRRLINIRMMTVYFMLPQEQHAEYKGRIAMLNKKAAFTFGVYQFQVLEKLGGMNSLLPAELSEEIERHNLLVRLPDADDNFYYLLDDVDFSADDEAFDQAIHELMLELSRLNIELTTRRLETTAPDSETAEVRNSLERVLDLLKSAIQRGKRAFKRLQTPSLLACDSVGSEDEPRSHRKYSDRSNTLKHLTSPMMTLASGLPGDSLFQPIFDQLAKMGVPEASVDQVKTLGDLFAQIYHTADAKQSKSLVGGLVNESSDALLVENCQRNEVAQKPRISIERVRINRYRRETSKYFGITIDTGERKIPIRFSGTDQTMIYLTALLRYKMGHPLYLHELYKNSKGAHSVYKLKDSRPWLKEAYHTLVGHDRAAFEVWIKKVQSPDKESALKKGQVVSQAKSASTRTVMQAMKAYPKESCYCVLSAATDANKDLYYAFNCPRENISICEELQPLMDKFAAIYH